MCTVRFLGRSGVLRARGLRGAVAYRAQAHVARGRDVLVEVRRRYAQHLRDVVEAVARSRPAAATGSRRCSRRASRRPRPRIRSGSADAAPRDPAWGRAGRPLRRASLRPPRRARRPLSRRDAVRRAAASHSRAAGARSARSGRDARRSAPASRARARTRRLARRRCGSPCSTDETSPSGSRAPRRATCCSRRARRERAGRMDSARGSHLRCYATMPRSRLHQRPSYAFEMNSFESPV